MIFFNQNNVFQLIFKAMFLAWFSFPQLRKNLVQCLPVDSSRRPCWEKTHSRTNPSSDTLTRHRAGTGGADWAWGGGGVSNQNNVTGYYFVIGDNQNNVMSITLLEGTIKIMSYVSLC